MGNEIDVRREVFRATEAESDEQEEGTWITLVREGESINGRNYKRNALRQAVLDRSYEGQRMFVDHSDGPPIKRSIKELVSGITKTKYVDSFPDGRARIRGLVKFFNSDFEQFASKAKEHIGVSHDAKLFGTRSRLNGRIKEDIDEIRKVHSVDWVVYPSAGGGFEFYAHEGIEVGNAVDWDALTPEMIQENAPELYKTLETQFSGRKKEAREGDDDDDDDGDGEREPVHAASNGKALDEKALESIVTRVVTRSLEAVEEKKTNQQKVHDQVSAAVNKSTLPDRTKQRIIRSFEGVETFDEERVKEAVEDAKAELKEAGAGPRVIGAGPSGGQRKTGSLGRAHEAVASAFGLGSKKKAAKNADKDSDEEADN